MIGIEWEDSNIDLTKAETIKTMMEGNAMNGDAKIYQMEKPYAKERSLEIWDMLNISGCVLAEESMFHALANLDAGRVTD